MPFEWVPKWPNAKVSADSKTIHKVIIRFPYEGCSKPFCQVVGILRLYFDTEEPVNCKRCLALLRKEGRP